MRQILKLFIFFILFICSIDSWSQTNINQKNHFIGFGYSKLFFADYFYEDYYFLHDAKREGPINSFHLNYYKSLQNNHFFIYQSLYYTNRTEYTFIENRDGRWGTPLHVPLTVGITDNYSFTNIDYLFSIDYCGRRKISPFIGLGFKIGNIIQSIHDSKTEIAYFKADPKYSYVIDSSFIVYSGTYKSSYYFSSLALNSNQGFIFSISNNINLYLSTFIELRFINNFKKIYSPSYFPALDIGFNTSITYKIKQKGKKKTNGG